ncbi:dUTP diphosphatase [Salmonella enterica subsp. enterica serovar Bareilly]|nr:dUTP diphosphatase [Salmonella enterica subsp. enterica serovar Bareilly]
MNKLEYILSDDRCEPFVGSEDAAGLDLRIFIGSKPRVEAIELHPGDTIVIGTGVKFKIPKLWVGLVTPRSSTGKLRIMLENTIGVIDSDYTGEVKLRVHNYGTETQLLYNFDRICQMVIVPHFPPMLRERVESLEETKRGENGFGHSGRN